MNSNKLRLPFRSWTNDCPPKRLYKNSLKFKLLELKKQPKNKGVLLESLEFFLLQMAAQPTGVKETKEEVKMEGNSANASSLSPHLHFLCLIFSPCFISSADINVPPPSVRIRRWTKRERFSLSNKREAREWTLPLLLLPWCMWSA